MSDKLFPPVVESTIPAFTNYLIIPFSLGIGTGMEDFNKIKLVVKDGYSNKQVLSTVKLDSAIQQANGAYYIEHDISSNSSFKNGNYYKIQIAFQKDDETGFFSETMIGKKIQDPQLTLDILNNYTSYKGICPIHNFEKVFSYEFNLYENEEKIGSSGVLIHKGNKDTLTQCIDEWEHNISFNGEKNYRIEYTITTINGYQKTLSKDISYEEIYTPAMASSTLQTEFNF